MLLPVSVQAAANISGAAAASASPYPFPGYAPQYPQPYMQHHHGATQLQADAIISLLTAISDKVGALCSAHAATPEQVQQGAAAVAGR